MTSTFECSKKWGDYHGVLAANAAARGDAPASGHKHRVDMVAAGFCFVFHVLSLSMWPTAEQSTVTAVTLQCLTTAQTTLLSSMPLISDVLPKMH